MRTYSGHSTAKASNELYRTNRDYLGVLRATGTGQEAVDQAVAEFVAAHRWEIQP